MYIYIYNHFIYRILTDFGGFQRISVVSSPGPKKCPFADRTKKQSN